VLATHAIGLLQDLQPSCRTELDVREKSHRVLAVQEERLTAHEADRIDCYGKWHADEDETASDKKCVLHRKTAESMDRVECWVATEASKLVETWVATEASKLVECWVATEASKLVETWVATEASAASLKASTVATALHSVVGKARGGSAGRRGDQNSQSQ
jgi:delta 1-pyrroline-5-carboxylate dehydrogenase